MPTTYDEAIDTIFGHFNTEWNAGSGAIVGYIPEIQWQGVGKFSRPDPAKFWIRVSNAPILQRQTSLRGLDTRYNTFGQFLVQLYCPKTESGITIGRTVAAFTRNIFLGQALETVKFVNVKLIELDPESANYRFDITARYEYSEIV